MEINTEGDTNVQAVAKFRVATDPNSGLQVYVHPNVVPVRGFTGSQVYNTYGSESEEGEPNPCGRAGGAPYWFSYQAPAAGTMSVEADTPAFTNVLAVYTGPGDSFATLVPVNCADTNDGTGNEMVVFPASNSTNYWIVVDGLNGETGNVTLSYSLTMPPAITTQPQSQTVPQGGNGTLTVAATGVPSPWYQWRTNSLGVLGQTNTFFNVSNFQAAGQGIDYDVVVTNSVGSVTSSAAALYLNSPLRFSGWAMNLSGYFTATLLGQASTNYIVQASTNLASGNWVSIATNNSAYGIISIMDTNGLNYPGRFYRAIPQ